MERLRQFVAGVDLRATGKWLVLASLVGIVGGLGAIALQLALGFSTHTFLGGLAGYYPSEAAAEPRWFAAVDAAPSMWRLVLVMAGGGLVSGARRSRTTTGASRT